jgi:predicted aminopeptidase
MIGTDSRWSKGVLRRLVLLAGAMLMQGCSTMGYYLQSAQGQIEVLAARRPIDAVIADETQSIGRREQLRRLKAMRQFASDELALPDNQSYTTFSDVRRPFVITNVFATPELSLTPVRSCFLVVGCLDYRGYFQAFRARRYADGLRRQGYDVYVGGVAAYSTLGWFDDPVLNSMLAWDEPRLAKFLFHELAHQQLYVRDDTAFNEAFAEAVAEVGLARWLARHTDPSAARRYRDAEAREQAFVEEVLRTRTALATAYASPVSAEEKRAMKTAAFSDFRERYRRMKARWGGYAGYDRWVYEDLNNARISAVVTYHDRIPAFRRLLVLAGEDLPRFYLMAASIGRMPTVDRRRCLDALAAGPDLASSLCRLQSVK